MAKVYKTTEDIVNDINYNVIDMKKKVNFKLDDNLADKLKYQKDGEDALANFIVNDVYDGDYSVVDNIPEIVYEYAGSTSLVANPEGKSFYEFKISGNTLTIIFMNEYYDDFEDDLEKYIG